jgi:inorganic triphosphatase YgiF
MITTESISERPERDTATRERDTATREREHEFKFLVPDDYEMPSFADVCVRTGDTVVEQTATNYATTDLRLARAGASLRFRDDDGWTV